MTYSYCNQKAETCDFTVIYHILTDYSVSYSLILLSLAVMATSRQPTPPVNQYTGSYTEDADGDGIRMNAFYHDDIDVAFDPLSANRRFPGIAGPTRESIDVMVSYHWRAVQFGWT